MDPSKVQLLHSSSAESSSSSDSPTHTAPVPSPNIPSAPIPSYPLPLHNNPFASHKEPQYSPNPPNFCKVILNVGSLKTKHDHRCTVECLNRYPIHHAARVGKFKELKTLLEEYQEKFRDYMKQKMVHKPHCNCPNRPPPLFNLWGAFERDECFGRTPLHYAAATGNVEKGLRCTKLLLDCINLMHPSKRVEKLRKFVNQTDYNNDTALHLAAKNEATNIVRELLLNQADLDITSHNGKCGLMEVYRKTPMAMNDALNQSISYQELCRREEIVQEEIEEASKRKISDGTEEIDFTHSYVSVCLNFYPLLGSKVGTGRGKTGAPVPETSFLYEINRNRMESEVRRIILNNVLVQSFLYFKWNKIKLFCFMAIFLHILWLALYILIVIDVFVVNCPYLTDDNAGDNTTDKHNKSMGHLDKDYIDEGLEEGEGKLCRVNNTVHFASGILLIISFGISIKELFQFIRLGSIYLRFENLGQCLLLGFIFVMTPNFYLGRVTRIESLHYQVAAFGIFLAWTLFLCQCAKLPRFCVSFKIFGRHIHWNLPDHGLYVEILSRVFKNFLVFISIFSSLLISFVFSFNILLPNSTGFINLSNSFLKVLTMMTGELNYDDIFHSEDEQLIYPVASHVMYALFIMVATIILFNLLIGFTVSDIQGLQKDAEVNQIGNKLEQIFLMECFLLSMPMQWFLRLLSKIFRRRDLGRYEILSSIMVTRRTARGTWYCYHAQIKSLPRKHRVEIRDWASKNCIPVTDIAGMQRANMFQSSFTRH